MRFNLKALFKRSEDEVLDVPDLTTPPAKPDVEGEPSDANPGGK